MCPLFYLHSETIYNNNNNILSPISAYKIHFLYFEYNTTTTILLFIYIYRDHKHGTGSGRSSGNKSWIIFDLKAKLRRWDHKASVSLSLRDLLTPFLFLLCYGLWTADLGVKSSFHLCRPTSFSCQLSPSPDSSSRNDNVYIFSLKTGLSEEVVGLPSLAQNEVVSGLMFGPRRKFHPCQNCTLKIQNCFTMHHSWSLCGTINITRPEGALARDSTQTKSTGFGLFVP